MSTEEKIKIMTASLIPAVIIQRKYRDPKYLQDWVTTYMPIWDWNTFDYRIKPEPKSTPYSNKNQFLQDCINHHGLLKHTQKSYTSISYPTEIREDGIIIQDHSYPWDLLLKCFVWADDGEPCGVKIE